MSAVYFALGCLVGILSGAAASRIDGPAPTYVFIVCGALVAVLLVLWTFERES